MTLVFILSGISFFPALFLGPIMESNDLYMGTLY
jgi:K+-transporting ATPase A subunit